MIFIQLIIFAIGFVIVVGTILSAIRAFVLPRSQQEHLTRYVFLTVRRWLELITRVEFDAAYDRLAQQGIPLKPNRDQCWLDFAGWRVNYDDVLLGLADVTMAPPAPWSSDRSQGKARELRSRPGRF